MKTVTLYANNPATPGLTAIRRQVEAAGKRLIIKPLIEGLNSSRKKKFK